MKRKFIIALCAVAFGLGSLNFGSNAQAAEGRGGIGGFAIGCCFGLRTVADWNEGKDLHWREWGRIIPYVGLVFAVWDGIDGSNGVTNAELDTRYPGNFY